MPGTLLNNSTLSWGMDDEFMARLGAEYTGFDFVHMRAGFIYDPSPFKDERASLATPRYTDVYTPTFGLGFNFDNLRMDIAYQFTISPARVVDYDDAYTYADPPPGAPDNIEVSGYSHIFTATGIYRF